MSSSPCGSAWPADGHDWSPTAPCPRAGCWLPTQWPTHLAEPSHYWVSTSPADTRFEELVRPARIHWRIEHDCRELKTALGLDHFEGRSWTGWHRHVTLVTAAQQQWESNRASKPTRREQK
ncbi:hypothetical protein [Kitasatospora sp. NPDC005856]|uniref:hypothetical protein n=1 Tax=Kitasatospora sp. NPDC005856 TaxID=3154566 RepID=UPI0033EBED52